MVGGVRGTVITKNRVRTENPHYVHSQKIHTVKREKINVSSNQCAQGKPRQNRTKKGRQSDRLQITGTHNHTVDRRQKRAKFT